MPPLSSSLIWRNWRSSSPFGGAGDDGASEFVGALLKFVEVGLPTLALHVLDGKSDLDFLLLRLRNTERQDNENERNSGEQTRRETDMKDLPRRQLSGTTATMSPKHAERDDGSRR